MSWPLRHGQSRSLGRANTAFDASMVIRRGRAELIALTMFGIGCLLGASVVWWVMS